MEIGIVVEIGLLLFFAIAIYGLMCTKTVDGCFHIARILDPQGAKQMDEIVKKMKEEK